MDWLARTVNTQLARWGVKRPMPAYATWAEVPTYATYELACKAAAEMSYMADREYVGVQLSNGKWDIRPR